MGDENMQVTEITKAGLLATFQEVVAIARLNLKYREFQYRYSHDLDGHSHEEMVQELFDSMGKCFDDAEAFIVSKKRKRKKHGK